ncbi:MAG: protealysin inhibitor emfourin [Myxococcales bacterium]
MRVSIERKGGVAGVTARGERADHELSAEQRAAVDSLLSEPPQPKTRKPDRFYYKVRIENEAGTHNYELSEEEIPPSLSSIPTVSL